MAFLVLMLNEKEMMKDNDFSQAVVKKGRALAHPKMAVLDVLGDAAPLPEGKTVTVAFLLQGGFGGEANEPSLSKYS